MSMETASIAQHCQTLRLGAIGAQFASLAEEARQQNHSHLHYLEALLQAEAEERERRSIELRLKDAHLPRMKTLEEFDFAQSPHLPASRIRVLAEGGIWNALNQCFWLGNRAPEKLTWPLAWPSRHVGRESVCVSRPLPRWLTNWSRHNANRASVGCWHAGRAWN